jgi:hypothetical protein
VTATRSPSSRTDKLGSAPTHSQDPSLHEQPIAPSCVGSTESGFAPFWLRSWDATWDSATHVLRRPDKFPEAVVIPILNAGRGNHDGIMVPDASKSTVHVHFAGSGRPRSRQLARKTPECRDRQLSWSRKSSGHRA